MITSKTVLLCVLSAGCVMAPTGPPREVATQLIRSLDTGEIEQATKTYRRVARDPRYRERIYPVVYETATKRYTDGDVATALPLLRFLVRNYERSAAAREALAYALFIERGQQAKPEPRKTAEHRKVVSDLLAQKKKPPIWVALIETQLAIDGGQLDAARESFSRFEAGWNGRPEDLAIYVEDLNRYLKTH